jgi:transposase
MLIESGHITLKEAYLDGTKIEANANRYTFVWGRSIKKSKERIQKQLTMGLSKPNDFTSHKTVRVVQKESAVITGRVTE